MNFPICIDLDMFKTLDIQVERGCYCIKYAL
jgi:hypothetical protein